MDIDITLHQHFSFDLWLTIIKSHPAFKLKRDQLLMDFFEIKTDFETVRERIRHYDVLCNKINEKTGLQLDTDEIYYLILGSLNVEIAEISADKMKDFYTQKEYLFLEYLPILIDPEIAQLFKKMKSKGKTISILSNTAFIKGATLRKMLAFYGLDEYFSFQLYSDETGFSKPNPLLFNIMKTSALQYNSKISSNKDIVHIGDNPYADYEGALSAGISAILVKP